MKIRRKDNGIIQIQINKNEKYLDLYHGYIGKRYILWYEKNSQKIEINNPYQIMQIKEFIENLEVSKNEGK